MVSMNPVDRMGDPGIGLADVPHRTLDYRKLRALAPHREGRTPSRRMEIHLTGNMERYMWSFDGKKFSAVSDEPIRFAYNERVRSEEHTSELQSLMRNSYAVFCL